MIRPRKVFALIAIVMSFMLVFTACDSVSGVNLNQVMKASLEQTSYEGRLHMSIEWQPGELEISDAAHEFVTEFGLLAVMPKLEIDLYEVKQQDLQTASMKGELKFGDISLPIAMSVSPSLIVIEVEGIERPLVMDVHKPYNDLFFELNYEQINEASMGLTLAAYEYLIPNLPNPKKIDISSASIELNGKQEQVRKIHAEIPGSEVHGLLEQLLSSLAADEEGLKQFLSEAYDALMPFILEVIEEARAQYGSDGEPDPIEELVLAYLNNKTLVTEFLFTTITQGYNIALDRLPELAEDEDWNSIFHDDTYMTVDLYLNRNMNIVQSDVELLLAPANAAGSLRITTSTQIWNINADVEAEQLGSTNGIMLDNPLAGEEILQAIDWQSPLGQLLSAFGLNQKTVLLPADQVHAENGVSFMTAYQISRELGLVLDPSADLETSVVFTDVSGAIRVELPLNQNIIIINGSAKEIPIGAFQNSVPSPFFTYVPVRAVAEAFGYEVAWNPNLQMIELTKLYR